MNGCQFPARWRNNVSETGSALRLLTEHSSRQTFCCVVEKCIVRMSSFQLGLPNVVMGVDETRRDDLPMAIDYFGLGPNSQVFPNLSYNISLYEKVGVSKNTNSVVCVVLENRATPEKNGGRRCLFNRFGHHVQVDRGSRQTSQHQNISRATSTRMRPPALVCLSRFIVLSP